jgi:hypothetical protein
MAFQKGISGNPGGKAKGRPWRDAIDRALKRRIAENDLLGIDKLADALIDKGIAGDVIAIREIGDRLEGKPTQALEHSGVIATTHEEYLKQLDSLPDDADGEDDTAPAAI